jgi:hypothetical protein
MENYKEAAWSSASGLEDHYKELEAKYDEQFNESKGTIHVFIKEINKTNFEILSCNKLYIK